MALRVPFSEYAWPTRSKEMRPFKHQIESVVFLLNNKQAYNFSDLGTGKTLSHLWACDFLMVNEKIRKVLIVSPLSTMQSVWGSEIFYNFPHRKYRIAHGSRDQRIAAIKSGADFVIINHDGVSIADVEKAIIQERFDIIIIDELTAFKKHTTNRSKAMQRITQAYSNQAVHGLTGAPTPNGPSEAFGQAKVVTPLNPNLPRYFKQFQPMVEFQVGPYMWIPTEHAAEVVNRIMQPAVRFKRDDCIDIPECQYVTQTVPFSRPQQEMYDKMRDDLMVEYHSGEITASNAAVKVMKLLQIAAGSVKDDEGSIVTVDASPREEALWEIFEEAGKKKLVVFSTFVASVLRLEEFFRSKGVKVATIYGSIDHKVRAQRIADFQDSDLQVLVIQPQSSAHGITLTASHVIVWYSLIASGEIYVQANGRITRAGQTKKQLIYHLIGCKAEQHLLGLLTGKGKMSQAVLGLFEAGDQF